MASDLVKYRVDLPAHRGGTSAEVFDDPESLRESRIPLPQKPSSPSAASRAPRRVLLLGTFGAGKSSVMRHLLGTAGEAPGFPAISPHKTTIAPTEVICSPEPTYGAAVTFTPEEEIDQNVRENILAACRQIARGNSDKQAAEALLVHADQRIRLNYILGKYTDVAALRSRRRRPTETEIKEVVRDQAHIQDIVDELRRLVDGLDGAEMAQDTDRSANEDETAETFGELIESDARYESLSVRVMRLIHERVRSIQAPGVIERDRSGWPTLWTYETSDRSAFMDALGTFTGNADYQFRQTHRLGQLLTPIVNGVRIKGPFSPNWRGEIQPLVLLDTQGLGHVVDGEGAKASSVPNQIVQWMRAADAIVLVDTGKQPMHEDPPTVLRTVATMGATRRFFLLFSHMDQVRGGPVATEEEAADHVWQSVNSVLEAMSSSVGPASAAAMRQRLERFTYFASHLNDVLSSDDQEHSWTLEQLEDLVEELATIPPAPEPPAITPLYTDEQVRTAVERARELVAKTWQEIVGVHRSGTRHWATIRALSVRLGYSDYMEGWNGLFPAADLRDEAQVALDQMLRAPHHWLGSPTLEEQETAIDDLVATMQDRMTDALVGMTKHRVIEAQRDAWQEAADQRGPGSTRDRAAIIREIMRTAVVGDRSLGMEHLEVEIAEILRDLHRPGGGSMARIAKRGI